jgi:hypothetical protein
MDISDATDILDTINEVSKNLLSDNERSAFADLMLEVMLKPDDEMKGYLAALCHGYFAYHALGLEPRCSDERLNIARQTAWLLDSSIILPLLAVDCLNHDYAKDLLQRIKSLGLHCYTTERLFAEVHEHARWAITNFAYASYDSAELLQAAMAGPGYKQNLFLDGFIKWSATQGRPSMDQYMIQCLGKGYSADLPAAVRHQVLTLGIEIRDFVSWPSFSQAAWAERDSISEEIAGIRRLYGTYTGTGQCDAEAEVVLICSREKAIFLSQSSILNKMSKTQTKISWRPEAMYRFLTLFSSVPPATDLLYQCMTQDFFYTGFDIVDNKAISHYAAPLIRQARMVLEQERATYEKALGQVRLRELEVAFEQIPDVEKPFYSMQFLAYVARQETKQREAAEERARSAEAAQGLSGKERDEYERLKSKKEEKRRKRLQRERRATSLGKQAKHKGKAHRH